MQLTVSADKERDEVECSLGPGLPAVVCCCDQEEHRKYRGCCDRRVISGDSQQEGS